MLKKQFLAYIYFIISQFYTVDAYYEWGPQQTAYDFKPLPHEGLAMLKKDLKIRDTPQQSSKLPPCSEDDLMVYLAEIQAINPESIINLSTSEDFTIMCTEVSESLDRIDEFLRTCQIPNEKDLYIQLIKGVDGLYDYLCNTTTHREIFQKYLPCYQGLHDEYEQCNGPADWTEMNDDKSVCKIYKEVTDCFYIKTAKLCGLKAARVMKQLMVHVFDCILTNVCDVKKDPVVKDAMPESAGTCKVSFYIFILTLLTIIINLR